MRIFITVILAFFCTGISAQGLQLKWVKGITGTDNVFGAQIVVDDQKNLFVKGGFSGTADFDPGVGTVNLMSSNGSQFIAKYDAQGNYVFAFQLIGIIEAIVLDVSGNIRITGKYDSTTDFDPGSGIAQLPTVSGSNNYYLAKYDNNGNYIKAFRLAYCSKSIGINAMVTDTDDNLYITGDFSGTAVFNPTNGTSVLVSNGSNIDVFMAKYSGDGSLIYAFRLGGTGGDRGWDIAIDPIGNAYLIGAFYETVDLDPGSGIASFTFPGLNGFLARFSPTGSYLEGYGFDPALYTIALDSIGNIYLTGHLQDSMDVDPGPGVVKLYSDYEIDIFMEKLNAGGKFQHAYAFKSNKYYFENGIAVDDQSSVYLYGYLQDTVYFSSAGSTGILATEGGRDGFLTKFDSSGNYLNGFSFGSTGVDELSSLVVNKLGDIWIAGTFNGTVDFDPGSGAANLTSTPKTGIFFGRYTDRQTTTDINRFQFKQQQAKVYGFDKKVYVDFTAMELVDAHVKVLNILGQTVAQTKHIRNDILQIELPNLPSQIFVVIIQNDGFTSAKKVWVD